MDIIYSGYTCMDIIYSGYTCMDIIYSGYTFMEKQFHLKLINHQIINSPIFIQQFWLMSFCRKDLHMLHWHIYNYFVMAIWMESAEEYGIL